jgi:CheY-like chemotaxis protein
VPIIAMTANVMPGDRERCLQAGMDDYVSKPVKSEELAEILQQWTRPMITSPAAVDTAVSRPSRPAPPRSPSALDSGAFTALRELCEPENPAFLQDLVESFLRDAESHIEAVRVALTENNGVALEGAAHALKSSSANIGALGMAEVCRTLQMLARTHTISAAPPLAEQLVREFGRVKQALQQECAPQPTETSS